MKIEVKFSGILNGNLVTNGSLCLEDEVFFLCGKYMDSLKVVCTTGGER